MQSTDQTAPGLAETATAVAAARPAAEATAKAQQSQAGRFIVEHGAAVVSGHADVAAAERS